MSEKATPVTVTPEARAQVIRSALNGRWVHTKLTAGQRRALASTTLRTRTTA